MVRALGGSRQVGSSNRSGRFAHHPAASLFRYQHLPFSRCVLRLFLHALLYPRAGSDVVDIVGMVAGNDEGVASASGDVRLADGLELACAMAPCGWRDLTESGFCLP